jgi:hypothetical protein
MTEVEYHYFLSFTKGKSKSIFKKVSCNLLKIEDFFFNAFAKQPENLHKQIVAEIYQEYYKQLGIIQRQNGDKVYDKKCNCCKIVKDSSLFYQKYSKIYQCSYLSSHCSDCYAKKYNSDKEKKRRIDNKEKTALVKKIYFQNNKEKLVAYVKQWRKENATEFRAKQNEYRNNNKEKINMQRRLHRLKKKTQ